MHSAWGCCRPSTSRTHNSLRSFALRAAACLLQGHWVDRLHVGALAAVRLRAVPNWKRLVVGHLIITVSPARRAVMGVCLPGVIATNLLRLVTDAWWLSLLGLVFVLGLLASVFHAMSVTRG